MLKEYDTAGAGLPGATATAPEAEYLNLPLDCIVPSPTQPRKRFNPAKLAELAASIKADEVHEPIVVRPLPASRLADTFADRKRGAPLPTHELVSGERRLRASVIAGKATIPARVKRYTDEQVVRIQIVENKQRDDLHPMEEAEGFQHMMALLKISADQVADEVGVSRGTVFARMKLLDLCEPVRAAFYDEKIDQSRALIIARVPDEQLQLKALAEATRTGFGGEVPSVREFRRWVRNNLMLDLAKARFKITDITLVPDAGSCRECPKRTGAAPDLFADVDSADVCTDTKCFHAKQATHDEQQLAAAKAKGQTIITGPQAKRIWEYEHSALKGFKRLDRTDGRLDGQKTLKKVLGKDCPETVLLQSPFDGSLIEVLAEEKVTQALKDKGLLTPAQARASREVSAFEAKAKAEEKYQHTWRKLAIEKCYEAACTKPDGKIGSPTIRLIAKMMLQGLVGDNRAHSAQLLGVGKVADTEGIRGYLDTCTDEEAGRTLLLLLMQHDMHFNQYAVIKDADRIQAVADDFEVDLETIQKGVQNAMKAAVKKSAKPVTPIAPAAQAKGEGGSKTKNIQAPLRKPKLSTADAQAAIAAAMQESETNPGADAQSNNASQQPASGCALAVGVRVCVTTDTSRLQLTQHKWAGKEGEITQQLGDRAWMVSFKGRSGGMTSFDGSELTAAV